MSREYTHFEFDPHALKRMRQRRISRRQILRTVTNPDRLYSGYRGRLVAEYTTNEGNTLSVVFEEHEHADGITAFIVTVIRKGAGK